MREHGGFMEDVMVGQQPHYPLPDIRLLPWNGSYGEMDPHTVSRLYMRCFGIRLGEWQWHEYDEGRFFSRFDKFPYWCRDMLAYRAALWSCIPWTRRVNKLRSFLIRIVRNVERVVNDATWRLQDELNRWFLDDDDLPAAMRHLWDYHYVQ